MNLRPRPNQLTSTMKCAQLHPIVHQLGVGVKAFAKSAQLSDETFLASAHSTHPRPQSQSRGQIISSPRGKFPNFSLEYTTSNVEPTDPPNRLSFMRKSAPLQSRVQQLRNGAKASANQLSSARKSSPLQTKVHHFGHAKALTKSTQLCEEQCLVLAYSAPPQTWSQDLNKFSSTSAQNSHP